MINLQSNNAEVVDAVYRNDVLEFAMRAMSVVEPGTKIKPNWHHRCICYHPERALAGDYAQLIINQPPKTLKTFLISICFVAWRLMHDPTLKIGIFCHDENLAKMIVSTIRQIMKSNWYKALAQGTAIASDKDTEMLFRTTMGGEVRAFSMQGGTTGHGFDIIIIDDPQKASTAHSEPERKSIEHAFSSGIANRWRDPTKGILIVVMQRLHVDDFTAFALKIYPQAKHLTIPVRAIEAKTYELSETESYTTKPGKLLEPNRLREDYLHSVTLAQGNDHFEAQYMQMPQMSAGTIIKPEWLRHFEHPRPKELCVISIDPAFTKDGGDYSAAIVANLVGRDVEITHAEQHQFDYPTLLNWINILNQRFRPDLFLIEAVGAGMGIEFHLRRDTILNVATTTPQNKSKTARMEMVSPFTEEGRLWLPQQAPWADQFVKCLTKFPYGPSDDWPDAVSQLLKNFDQVYRLAKYWREEMHPTPIAPHEQRRSMHHRSYQITCDPI